MHSFSSFPFIQAVPCSDPVGKEEDILCTGVAYAICCTTQECSGGKTTQPNDGIIYIKPSEGTEGAKWWIQISLSFFFFSGGGGVAVGCLEFIQTSMHFTSEVRALQQTLLDVT